jgi:hypothetical protein
VVENPYAPPKSEVGAGADETENAKPTAIARFLWTTIVGFPVFMLFVLMTPREMWLMGALGSAAFAVFAGLIALCIPVRHKILFIAPGILVCIVIAYLIGTSR